MNSHIYLEFLKYEYYAKFEEKFEELDKKYSILYNNNKPIIIGITSSQLNKYIDEFKKTNKDYNYDDSITYNEYLKRLISQKGFTIKKIYETALLDKSTMYNALKGERNKKKHTPSKNTLLRISFAMHLTLDEAYILLTKAGQYFVKLEFGKINKTNQEKVSSTCDNILQNLKITEVDRAYAFLLEHKIYDFNDIEDFLKQANLPPLIPDKI